MPEYWPNKYENNLHWCLNTDAVVNSGTCFGDVAMSGTRQCLGNLRIVDLRITDHTHEEGTLVGQGFLFLAIQHLVHFVRRLL